MQITEDLSDETMLGELGRRLARFRLNLNMTQGELAYEAGISRATLQRIEAGESAQIGQYIRLLKALHLTDNLDALLPEVIESPVQQVILNRRGKPRERAFPSSRRKPSKSEPWKWGDEP
jgi:transcriptional regulator with XRE-family HTH domain